MVSPSVRSSATSILPSSTVPVIRPTAQIGSIVISLVGIDQIAHGTAQRKNAAVKMAGRMNAVAQQRPGMAARKIDPQSGAGKAGMTNSVDRAALATRPAIMGTLPAMGAAR